jgi:hypothetical protein
MERAMEDQEVKLDYYMTALRARLKLSHTANALQDALQVWEAYLTLDLIGVACHVIKVKIAFS